MQTERIVFLGTGDAFSAGGRFQAAYLLQNAGSTLLIDCGSGVLASLKRNELAAAPIDTVLLSHFHGDHFAGLPFLLLHYVYVEPRTKPLRIVGPPEVEGRVMQLYRAMYADSACQPASLRNSIYRGEAGEAARNRWVSNRFIPGAAPGASALLRIRDQVGKAKACLFGRYGWTEDLLEHTEDADLFICECSFFETRMPTHLDYPRIAENLHRFGSKRTVLTHLGQEVLSHRSEVELEMAHDGLVVIP